MEGRRERGQLMEKKRGGRQRRGVSERDDTKMTFDYVGCLDPELSHGQPLRTPCCFHTATPQPEHTDQNNMAER